MKILVLILILNLHYLSLKAEQSKRKLLGKNFIQFESGVKSLRDDNSQEYNNQEETLNSPLISDLSMNYAFNDRISFYSSVSNSIDYENFKEDFFYKLGFFVYGGKSKEKFLPFLGLKYVVGKGKNTSLGNEPKADLKGFESTLGLEFYIRENTNLITSVDYNRFDFSYSTLGVEKDSYIMKASLGLEFLFAKKFISLTPSIYYIKQNNEKLYNSGYASESEESDGGLKLDFNFSFFMRNLGFSFQRDFDGDTIFMVSITFFKDFKNE